MAARGFDPGARGDQGRRGGISVSSGRSAALVAAPAAPPIARARFPDLLVTGLELERSVGVDAFSDRVLATLESVAEATGYLFAANLASLDRLVREAADRRDIVALQALTEQRVEAMRLRDALEKDLHALRDAASPPSAHDAASSRGTGD